MFIELLSCLELEEISRPHACNQMLLNGSRISRLFVQKDIWLKPVENIQDVNQCLITDVLPVSPFMDYPQKWVAKYVV